MSEHPLMDAAEANVISLPRETSYASNGIVSRTLLRTANSRVVLFGFAAGQELTEHTSTRHATVQVLSGECEFDLGQVTHTLKPGDYVCLPPGQPHAVRAITQCSLLLTLVRPEESA
jgi:quercetin dioxygenase-like cupin family protein